MMKLNVENIETWVLVTGLIRSGTTFAGKALSLPLAVDYLHEPFNGGWSLPEGKPFERRYMRPDASGAEARRYREHVAHLFRYDFALHTTGHAGDPWYKTLVKQTVGSRGPVFLHLAKLNPFHRAAIIKDPTALLTTEYLYRAFGVKPVIVVRHPVSWAASLRRMDWWPTLSGTGFAKNPRLFKDYLEGEKKEIGKERSSPLSEAMACWRLAYKMVRAQIDKYPDWQLVTHEALCRRPLEAFRRLYDTLGLSWSRTVAWRLRRMTRAGSAEARGGQAMDLNRDSAALFEKRRDAVPREERQAIFEQTAEVALHFYDRASFALD